MTIPAITYDIGSIPEWLTSVAGLLALIGVWIAYLGHVEKTRPYLDIHIRYEIVSDNWYFFVDTINKGQYPVYSKITKALFTIGDERYPTIFDDELVIFPGQEKKFFAPIGYINSLGRQKIREAKFTKNIVEILVEVSSRKIKQQKYSYKTLVRLQVLVEEANPQIKLLEQRFI
jgi:hypothetical protein